MSWVGTEYNIDFSTVGHMKMRNMRTIFKQFLCVFDGVLKQIDSTAAWKLTYLV